MILRVDQDSAVPPYEQIRGQVATMVQTGVLVDGSRLPAIRQLAKDLGLATGTVARAYRELEADGVVETRGRHGTAVVEAVHHGAELEQALDAVRHAFVDLETHRRPA